MKVDYTVTGCEGMDCIQMAKNSGEGKLRVLMDNSMCVSLLLIKSETFRNQLSDYQVFQINSTALNLFYFRYVSNV
jgi:hypothetical protein